MMRQRWGLGTVWVVSGMAAALIAACSGDDIPPISNAERDAIEDVYGDDQMGAAGASMSGVSGAGGGSMIGRGGSGSGGTPPVGRGGSGSVVGGGGGGGDVPCDAPVVVFAARCADPATSCHGAGSSQGDFAASEEAAIAYLDKPVVYAPECGLLIDSSNPEQSGLLTKTQDPVPPGCGQRMPLTGEFLTADQEACILSWLSQFGD
jgi:hypothetical protein